MGNSECDLRVEVIGEAFDNVENANSTGDNNEDIAGVDINADIRYFRFSSRDFGGFICKIKISDMKDVKSIEETCVGYLNEVLTKYNFIELKERLMRTEFHVHISLKEILQGSSGETFYICDCPRVLEEI